MTRLLVLVLVILVSAAASADPIHLENRTKPSRCAENDNVDVRFIGSGIGRFTVEARPPAYLAGLTQDSTRPDFTNCDQSSDPVYRFSRYDVTLFQDSEWKLVAHRFDRFWRPDQVDVRAGDLIVHGVHLLQLIRKLDGRDIEVLVVYPADGYWRLKPLPPAGLADTAYGSSFLVGPISGDGRPYVSLRSVAFDRARLSFRLGFDAGDGSVRLLEASPDRTKVEVTLPEVQDGTAFAALRSMFVSTDVADTAEAVIQRPKGGPLRVPVADMPATDATTASFVRIQPSRHNTSAPDLVFGEFRRR